MVKVKICGITNIEDARAAVRSGCDALGFVFYKKSPRYIAPVKAAKIIKKLPKRIIKAGVFVNSKESTVKRTARLCRLDMLQFHGNESPEFCDRFGRFRVIKAFRVKAGSDLDKITGYRTFAYLFDSFVKSRPGGTGKKFDWGLIRNIINRIDSTVFLSGGLTGRNVRKAITLIRPDWVDVSSSVERRPGRKSHKKVADFIKAAKKKRG